MINRWIDWENNLLLLLKEKTDEVQANFDKKRDDDDWIDVYLAYFEETIEEWVRDLYFDQYLGMQYELDVADGILPGEYAEFDTKRLHDSIEAMRGMRDMYDAIKRCVQTEGHTAMNCARYHAADDMEKRFDVFATKTWDATLDDRTRLTHILLNGQTIDFDKYFWTVNGAARFPGDFGIPEEDINCRCVLRCNINGEYKRITGKIGYDAWVAEVRDNAEST